MSFGVSPEQSRPYDVRTTQPFTCIYSKEINENIGCSQILFIYIHALTQRWESEHVQARKFARAAASATVRGHGNVDQRNVDK